MSDTVEQIKSRLDIADIISGYLKLSRAGANWKARCPFHNEKTPSFYISPQRQSWHCFGCNKGGDMFSFVQEIEGIDFVESLRILATKAGVQLPERSQRRDDASGDKEPLFGVVELACKFFEKQLHNSPNGAKALEYLRARGLTDETIRAWRIGWAPNDWRALTAFLTDAGHLPKHLVDSGLAVSRDGRLYDRFRSRITFPIHDVHGHPVAFTARVFGLETTPEGEPLAKYINSPQTPIYDKGKLLFGLDKAKVDIRKQNSCLVVEGNMDAIMAWQSGTTHVVATSGTALTLEQLRLVGRYSKALTFCFDADQAGAQATRRAIGLAMSQNFNVHLTTLGDRECKDPADYVRKYGSAFAGVVASAKPALDYYWQSALASYDPASAGSKKAIIASVGPLIRRLTSRVEQSHWIGQIAVLLRVDQASVQADVASVTDDLAHTERADEQVRPTTTPIMPQDSEPDPVDPASFELLTLLTRDPSLVSLASDVLDMVDSRVAQIIQDPATLSDPQSPHKHLIDMAHMRGGELYAEVEPDALRGYASQLTMRLAERALRARRIQLQAEIQLATQNGDHAKVRILLATFQDYTKQLQDIQSQQSRI